ncbi:hypothetical protein VTO73DRAFT_5779 [Trametes versicolor]
MAPIRLSTIPASAHGVCNSLDSHAALATTKTAYLVRPRAVRMAGTTAQSPMDAPPRLCQLLAPANVPGLRGAGSVQTAYGHAGMTPTRDQGSRRGGCTDFARVPVKCRVYTAASAAYVEEREAAHRVISRDRLCAAGAFPAGSAHRVQLVVRPQSPISAPRTGTEEVPEQDSTTRRLTSVRRRGRAKQDSRRDGDRLRTTYGLPTSRPVRARRGVLEAHAHTGRTQNTVVCAVPGVCVRARSLCRARDLLRCGVPRVPTVPRGLRVNPDQQRGCIPLPVVSSRLTTPEKVSTPVHMCSTRPRLPPSPAATRSAFIWKGPAHKCIPRSSQHHEWRDWCTGICA